MSFLELCASQKQLGRTFSPSKLSQKRIETNAQIQKDAKQSLTLTLQTHLKKKN